MREITLYNYNELPTEDAKEMARQQVIECDYFGDDLNAELRMTFKEKLEGLGVGNLDLEYSLSYSQGDGVAFYGYIDNDHLWNWVDESVLSDDEIKLVNMCVLGKANLDINIERNHWGHSYSHWNCMEVNIPFYDGDDLPFDDDKMEELMRGLESKIKDVIQMKSRALENLGYDMIEEFDRTENIERLLDEYCVEFDEEGYLI